MRCSRANLLNLAPLIIHTAIASVIQQLWLCTMRHENGLYYVITRFSRSRLDADTGCGSCGIIGDFAKYVAAQYNRRFFAGSELVSFWTFCLKSIVIKLILDNFFGLDMVEGTYSDRVKFVARLKRYQYIFLFLLLPYPWILSVFFPAAYPKDQRWNIRRYLLPDADIKQ